MDSSIDGRMILAGERVETAAVQPLMDPFRGEQVASVSQASAGDVDHAVKAAATAQPAVATMPVHARADALRTAADIMRARAEYLAQTISRQTGKALRDARREIERATLTVRSVATAAEQLSVSLPPSDAIPGAQGIVALATRVPLGVIAAITPFNAPFNLVMHKLAPALAAGNTVIVKPAPQAPLSALQAAEILVEAGFPAAAISVLPGGPETGEALVSHPAVAAVSFTGGRAAATAIGRAAPLKRLLFELGGNSPNIVHEDADLTWSARALTAGAFSNTGQSCNSVQRVLVHESVHDELLEQLKTFAGGLVTGDPLDEGTDVGTLVNEDAARRVETWIAEARSDGARVITGGTRDGALLAPTILSEVQPLARIACEEVFGPVMVVMRYRTLDDAIELANGTAYGLQAAVFTRSLEVAFRIARTVEAGAILVNRSTNYRLDQFPFGGTKESGTTREGGMFSLEEMTSIRLVMIDADMAGAPHPLARAPRS